MITEPEQFVEKKQIDIRKEIKRFLDFMLINNLSDRRTQFYFLYLLPFLLSKLKTNFKISYNQRKFIT
ncbi:predicted protein [Methanosarcina acetivorans C2A]|uniref:Uncharacterized protein n=1 Tax=Methanosarcina acetivorans (strain ATCC 35395 / DSM 2834 / JCM 12185 / C2A) TaxID=188937 RepID=Q8TTD9_METAC|nr:predicted protein [Methanosarcina acetivorans C2A]